MATREQEREVSPRLRAAMDRMVTREQERRWVAGEIHRVERMTSMDMPNPSPPDEYITDFDEAETAAIFWAMSEPWRRHARVAWVDTSQPYDHCVHYNWYSRAVATRELVIERF